MSTLSQRLRQMADHTGLDAVAELLREAAEQLERRHAESEGRAERIAALYEQIEHEEELNSKLMAERTATMQRIVDKQTGYVRSKHQGDKS